MRVTCTYVNDPCNTNEKVLWVFEEGVGEIFGVRTEGGARDEMAL